ncbi:phosphatase PAP2 family protein [Massilia sp. YIM B02769]|uniref:phosphatase PAP2 family protein n=1 Tax=Massilia sp. YIM B02769 TaxID=3050129 RepID=UPI0025B6DE88|nr:phosphatase PAP2 family protein [Massilia sp. YIM B02769]MDN4060980.1 phosphatase PAP2 family protein [Massilia sp. YIM B02769]
MLVTQHNAAPALIGARTAWRIAAVLLASAAFLFWLGRCTDIDLMLADDFYDAGLHDFPWHHAWLTETFSHGILKMMLTLAAVGCILLALQDAVRPKPGRSPLQRLRLRVIGLSALLVPLVISTLKQASVAHCPWDLARYGGSEPYLRLFDALPFGVQPGHCLPAGHASSALWLVSLCVLWLPERPRTALRALVAALAIGGAVGWLQQLRGAHFLTHTLWSVWIACAVVFTLLLCLQWLPAYRRSRVLRLSS